MGGIYLICCTKNENFYIGRAKDANRRFRDHLRDLRKGTHKNPRLQNCYNKYGEDSLDFILFTKLEGEDNQVFVEQQLIDFFIGNEKCMNINRTAGGGCIVPMTEERRERIGRANRGKTKGIKRPPEFGRKISASLMGHKLSEETKRKISEAHKGKTYSDEYIENHRRIFSGKGNPMYGRRGANNPRSKSILQFDMEDNLVAEHPSAASLKELGFDPSCVGKVCKGRLKSAYGYKWEYKKV